jgi:hypothetical protein
MSDPIQTFTSLIYPARSSWIALCLIPPDARSAEHRFMTVDSLPRFLAYARYRNSRGWGVYVTPSLLQPNPANRRKQSFQDRQSIIYLDCDQPDCLDLIRQRYPHPTLIVRTSKGRYQVYWRLGQPLPIVAQEQLMSSLAKDVGADLAATDVSRVLRLPGFWNRKPNRNNTVDIVFSRDYGVCYQSLSLPARNSLIQPLAVDTPPSTAKGRPPVLDNVGGRSGLSESERDWYEVHRRLALGHDPSAIIDWLQRKRADKPKPGYYAQLTVQKAVQSRSNRA